MAKFTTSPRLFHQLLAPLEPFIAEAVQHYHADYRAHKFQTAHHLRLSLFAQLIQASSGRALIEELNDTEGLHHERNLRQMIGFDKHEFGLPIALDQSSFSLANATHDFRVWRRCFHRLWPQVKAKLQPQQLSGLGQVLLVNGSFFDCLPQMFWADYGYTANKVKGHFFYDLAGLPQKLVLTHGKGSERKVLRQQLQARCTYVVDRGYNDYQLYRQMIEQHAHLVTRLKKSATLEILTHRPVAVNQAIVGVISDQTVRLGSAGNTVELRQITYRDSQGYQWHYLTSRFDLEPLTVVELYTFRWQIELFFGWIKRHLQLGHWYSHDKNGVLIQLYAALLVFLLLKLYSALSNKVTLRRFTLILCVGQGTMCMIRSLTPTLWFICSFCRWLSASSKLNPLSQRITDDIPQDFTCRWQ